MWGRHISSKNPEGIKQEHLDTRRIAAGIRMALYCALTARRNAMNASGRRQRQAANGFAHLAPRQRPNYKKRDAATSAARLRRQIDTERRMSQNKGKKK